MFGIFVGVSSATTESADCVSRSAEIILPPQFANDPTVLKSHY